MALVSGDGVNFFQIPDDERNLAIAKEKGYQPYMQVTGDGSQYLTIRADVDQLKIAREKGYVPAEEWAALNKFKDERQTQFTTGEAAAQGVAESSTLGLLPKATAGLETLFRGGSYEKNLEAQRYLQQQAEEQHPLATGAGKLAGMAGAALVTGGASGAQTLGQKIAAGMATGGVTGGIEAFGESRAKGLGEEAADVATGTLTGLATGGVLTAGLHPIQTARAIGAGASVATKAAEEAINAVSPSVIPKLQKMYEWVPTFGQVRSTIGAAVEGTRGYYNPLSAAVKGVQAGIDDFLNSKQAIKDYREAARTLRESLQAEVGDEVNRFSDDTLMSAMLAQPGDNAAKDFVAIQTQRNTGVDKELVKNYLRNAPEAEEVAKGLDPINSSGPIATALQQGYADVQRGASAIYGAKLAEAAKKFEPQDSGIQNEMRELAKYYEKTDVSGTLNKALEGAFYELTPPGAITRPILEYGELSHINYAWPKLSGPEQFDRYTKALSTIKNALIEKEGSTPVSQWSSASRGLKSIQDAIEGRMQSVSDVVENNKEYKLVKDSQDLLTDFFKKDPSKVTQEDVYNKLIDKPGNLITRSEDVLRMAKSLQETTLPAEIKDPLVTSLKGMAGTLKASGEHAQLNEILGKFGKAQAAGQQKAQALFGKKSPIASVLAKPGDYVNYRQQLEQTANQTFGKSLNQLPMMDQLNLIGQFQKKGIIQ